MARLGSFRANSDGLSTDSWAIYVFDDGLIELRPSTISAVPGWLESRPGLFPDMAGRSLDKREGAVLALGEDTSSQAVAQQFKWAKRTAFADTEGIELHHGGKVMTACDLTIRTTSGETATLLVQAEDAEYVRDLLARALGSRFHTDLSSNAPT